MAGKLVKDPRLENARLRSEIAELRLRLDEAEQALEAIRTGQAESLIVEGPDGPRIFSLEGADNSYRMLVESMNEGAATLNEDGTVLYCNSRFAEMFDLPLERVMGREITGYLPDRSREIFEALVREAEGGESRGELELILPDGRVIPVYLSISMIDDGIGRRFCLVASDLSAQKRSEAIIAAEKFARLVLDQAADALVVCDGEGRVIRASRAASELCGGSPLMASFDVQFPVKLDDPGALSGGVATNALGGNVLRAVSGRLERAGGPAVPLLVSAAPLIDGAGRITGCIISMSNITERKRIEDELLASEAEARRQFAEIEAIYRSAGVGLCALDRDLRFVRVNERLAEMNGTPGEAHLGRTLREVVPQLADQGEAIARRVLQTGEAVMNVELSGPDPGAPPDHVRVRVRVEHWLPLKDERGEIVGINVVADDITERKTLEEALRTANLHLADADRRKTEFMAVLSHELRNPLAPIQNSLAILDRAPAESEQALLARAIIKRQIDQLVRLVDDLLEVTRITQSKIQLQPQRLDLVELVRRTSEDHLAAFAIAGVEFTLNVTPVPLRVNADPVRIAQIIGNLLQNSVKFTARGGHATLAVEQDRSERAAVIRVRDTGMGIDPLVMPQLFRPFMQAESTLDRTRGGLGLGLAIVKGLVDLHGGTVEVHSDGVGKGAEFVVRFPLASDVAGFSETDRPESALSVPRRVLIIEDNVDAAASLRMLLELEGHEIAVAHSGPDGLAVAMQFHPEIVLCDIGLPGMDGYDVAASFRSNPVLQNTFLVALTGYGLPEDVQQATDAGFACHLTKPPRFEDLRSVIARASGPDEAGPAALQPGTS